jgi:uncharacterized protein YcbX
MGERVMPAVGSVVSLWRYPVKSMMGEELGEAHIGVNGLAGDRVCALIDRETGKVASAKHPHKWACLMECSAQLLEDSGRSGVVVNISLPDGRAVRSDDAGVDRVLSDLLGREVTLAHLAPEAPSLEEYSPDMDELDDKDVTMEAAMPARTFFDVAAVHVLTTATLRRLQELYPGGRLDLRRFRPNIVIELASGGSGFVENEWAGRSVGIGDDVRLEITQPCRRCVMTTLPQGDLPRDPAILRTTARYNDVNAGVYAAVRSEGRARQGAHIGVE